MQEWKVLRCVDRDAAGRHDAAQQCHRFADQVGEADRGWPQLERAGFEAGHVKEIGHEPGQAVRLQLNELQQFRPVLGTQACIDLAQVRHSGLDGRQRRPQVVRCRPHEGSPPAVDLVEQARPQGLLAQLGAVDRQSCLVGERAEQAPIVLHQLDVLEHEHADGPVTHDQGHRHPSRAGVVEQSEGSCLTSRCHRGHVHLRQRLPRPGRHPQRRSGPQVAALALALGQHERRPARRKDGLHDGNHVRQQLRQREIADQRLRQLVEPFGLHGPALRLLPGAAQLGHDLGDDQDHRGIDGERDPVLGRADGQRVVGREEEEVVDEEPSQCAHDAGKEAADHDTHQCGQYEHQRRGGRAEVGSEREQQGQQRAQPGQRDDDCPRGPLVGFPVNRPAWSDVRHNYPSFGASSECTDALTGPGEARWR